MQDIAAAKAVSISTIRAANTHEVPCDYFEGRQAKATITDRNDQDNDGNVDEKDLVGLTRASFFFAHYPNHPGGRPVTRVGH